MASSSLSLSPFSSSPSLFDDDSDWELTVVGDVDSVSDADWVITGDEGYYVPSRSMAGVFVPFNNQPAFISFQPNSLSLCDPSAAPTSYSVSSSSHGLVLSRRPWSSYFVSNPSTGAQTFLPKPPGPHPAGSPLTIVVCAPAYHVICAVAGARIGFYRFSTFSSSRGAWRSSEEEYELARIVPNTGVSCGTFAYWRTESRTVVEYDVIADQARTLMPPMNLSDAGDKWQLGRAGEKLCCALATGSNLEVYALGVKDQWTLVCSIGIVVSDKGWDGGEPIVCREWPQPLRFESDELEVLLMVDGKLVVLGLENRKMKTLQFEKPAPDHSDEYVPYIDDPLASVDFSVDTLSAK